MAKDNVHQKQFECFPFSYKRPSKSSIKGWSREKKTPSEIEEALAYKLLTLLTLPTLLKLCFHTLSHTVNTALF